MTDKNRVKPARTELKFNNIPQKIKDRPQWVVWRYDLDKQGRWTKVPYQARNPSRKASSTSKETWVSGDVSFRAYNKNSDLDGIGFVLAEGDGITGVDLDHCIDDAGNLLPWAQEIVDHLDSYTEITPSGQGLRIFVEGKLPGTGRKKDNIEVYDKARFLTVTGHHLREASMVIQDRQEQLDTFMDQHFSQEKTPQAYEPGESVLSDDEVIQKASDAKNGGKFKQLWGGGTPGYPSLSEADLGLCSTLAFYTKRDPAQMDRLFRASKLMREKWDEKRGEKTYGQITIETAISSCTNTYTPSPPSENTKGEPKENKGSQGNTDAEPQGQRRSQADILLGLAETHVKEFFTDQYKEPYAIVGCGDHQEIMPIESTSFKRWIKGIFYKKEGRGCSQDAVNIAIDTLSARAVYAGSGEKRLSNRVAWHDGAIYYDLSDPLWRGVRITAKGWEIISEMPPIFRRYKNQSPQVEPLKKGDIKKIFNFVNIEDEGEKLMFLVWLVAAFIPDFPHAILHIHGAQGSAKSYTSRVIKMILDPGTKKTDALPRSQEDLIKRLNNNYLTALDNLSGLPPWASDTLCRAVTGEGHSERALYTNNEEYILEFQHVVALNGINPAATAPDILDRSITIELKRISSKSRKREKELDQAFQKALPGILGGIFNVIRKAIKKYPSIEKKISDLPRMADFAVWGYAIGEALGGRGEEFMKAYRQNINNHNFDVVSGTPVALALMEFMKSRDTWEGTANELLEHLEAAADSLHIKTMLKSWPQDGKALSRKLNTLKTNLAETGFDVQTGIRKKNNNIIRVAKNTSGISNDKDAKAGNHSADGEKGGDNPPASPLDASIPTTSPSHEPVHKAIEGDNGDNGDKSATPEETVEPVREGNDVVY